MGAHSGERWQWGWQWGLAVGVGAHRNTEWCSPPATEMPPVSLEADLSIRPRGAEVAKPTSIQTEAMIL